MIPNSHYKMKKMPCSQDTLVTSSQEEAGDNPVLGPSMILEPCQAKSSNVNPHLKMVAKVIPWTVRGQDKTDTEAEEDVIFDNVLAKKQQAFPWFSKFNSMLKNAFGKQNYAQLDGLMDFFIREVSEDVECCYRKRNRAWKLKTKMIHYLRIFHTMYLEVKQPMEYDRYAEKMSVLVSMYLDMEIKASRRHKESPRAIAFRLTSTMFVFLGGSKIYILGAILKAKLFTKLYSDICIPIIIAVVNDIPRELDSVEYIHYILIFKKWKMLVRKEERADINRKAKQKLSPPLGFAECYDSEKYSSKQLLNMAQGAGETLTLMLMHDAERNVKNNSEMLVRKDERADINWKAAQKLSSSFEFAECYDSEKYCSKQMQNMAKGAGEAYTLSLMKDPGCSVKKKSEGYSSQMESKKDKPRNNQDFELKVADLGEEYTVLYEEETNKDKELTEAIIDETYDRLFDLSPDDYEDDFFSTLEEDDFAEGLRKWQEEGERNLIKSAAAKLAINEKNNQVEADIVSPISALISMPKRSLECFGFSKSKANATTTLAEPLVRSQNEVPKMEADSQSQDDISVIYNFDEISHKIKTEPEDRVDEEDVVKSDMTPPTVLKAVVRPESIEHNVCTSTKVYRLSLNKTEDTEIEDGFPGFSSEPENSVPDECCEVLNSKSLVAEQGPVDVSLEERVLENKASSTVYSGETNQPSSAPGSNGTLLEEFPKYPSPQKNGLFTTDADGHNYFSEILDPTGDIFFSSEEFSESNISYWPSQDFFLGQNEDGFFSHYENGGTNHFPDFYNDQQDLVFTEANLVSPPMMDMIRDDSEEPAEYQLPTTHWDDLSMMASDTTPAGTEQERLSSPEIQNGPIVVFMEKPKKKRKGKAKSKTKVKTSPRKDKGLFEVELEPLIERKCKIKPVEEESKRVRQPPRRKRGRQEKEEVVEEKELVEQDEEEPEPQPKKCKGRRKKQPAPSPPTPPPTNLKKPRGGSLAQGVTKKKAQSRRRK